MTDTAARLTAALTDRYTVERELGAGGMATVYLAQDIKHNRKVAIKVLQPELAVMIGAKRFLKEIEVTANLQHPHILPLFDSGEADGFLFFVMPFVEGESLRERLARDGRLPLSDAIRIVREVADALAHAHSRGIVHRDIKPENVMVSGRHASVTDFGVSRAVSEAAERAKLTTAGVAIGTPAYMAPEQALADPRVDHRADIYGLGVLAYEVLAGTLPFAEGTAQEMLAAHLTARPRPLTEPRPDTPVALAALIERCLEKDPADRFAHCEEIVRRLEGLETPESGTTAVAAIVRRPWRVATALVGAVAAAALIALAIMKGGSTDSVPESQTALAVFPFTVRGGPDVQYLGEGIVNLLATSLDGAGELRSVDSRAVLATAERQRPLTMGPEQGARLANELDAGLFILGDIVQLGERIRIDAGLYDRRNGAGKIADATAQGDPAAVLDMVDEIAAQLLASGVAGAGSRVTQIAAVTTGSLTALKSYLEGEDEFRAGRFTPAVEAFQNAVMADSQFALAFYRLSIAAEWALLPDLAQEAAEGAVQHGDRLSEHYRRLLEALLVHRRGEYEDAERMFGAIVAVWPQDVEAWVQLAEVRFHYYPLAGRDFTESAEAFARVLSFEPNDATSLIHMQRIAARRGDLPAVDSIGRRIRQLNPQGDRALEAMSYRAALSEDPTVLTSALTEIASAPDIFLPQISFGPSIWTDSLARIGRLMEMETAPGRATEVRALGHVHLAYLEAMQGRWSSARQQLALAEALNRVLGLEHRAFLTLMPFLPASDNELGQLHDALSALDPDSIRFSQIPSAHFTVHDNLHAVLKAYLLGHINVRLGDQQAAVTAARTVSTLPVDPAMVGLRDALARGIEDAVAEARGDDASAGREMDRLEGIGNYEPALFSPFVSLAAERYRRAARLEALGDLAEATRGYASFENFNFYDRVFAAPAQLRLAQIAEREGRLENARQHYGRFLFLWSEAEDGLRFLVEEARSALTRIGETGG